MEFETHLTSESFFKFFVTSATYPITANVWRKNDSLMFKRVNMEYDPLNHPRYVQKAYQWKPLIKLDHMKQ